MKLHVTARVPDASCTPSCSRSTSGWWRAAVSHVDAAGVPSPDNDPERPGHREGVWSESRRAHLRPGGSLRSYS